MLIDILIYGFLFIVVAGVGLSFRAILRKIQVDAENSAHGLLTNNVFAVIVENELVKDANEIFVNNISKINSDILEKYKSGTFKFSEIVCDSSLKELENLYSQTYIKDYLRLRLVMKTCDGENRNFDWDVKLVGTGKLRKQTFMFIGSDKTDEENQVKSLEESAIDVEKLNNEIAMCEGLLSTNAQALHMNEIRQIETETKHNFIMESINVGVWEYDYLSGRIYFSEKCRSILNLDALKPVEEILPDLLKRLTIESYFTLLAGAYDNIKNCEKQFEIMLQIHMLNSSEFSWVEFSGHINYDENRKLASSAGSFLDMTENKQYELNIERLAFNDVLTGSYNRTFMKKHINENIAKNPETNAAFVFFDVDDFRYINESFGHSFGDDIILNISKRLTELSKGYAVSRFSGDEMAVFLTDSDNMVIELIDFVEKIRQTFNMNYYNDDLSYKISISVGVSLYPEHGTDFDTLLQCADIALNEAKKTGKNKYVFFTENMNKLIYERMVMESELRHAIDTSTELQMYLQPQYDINTGKLFGFESLSRWISPVRGFISPAQFITLAEETRLIMPLGRWILFESCKIIRELHDRGYDDINISVNLSPVQLLDDMLVLVVKDVLDRTQINPSLLELEITESILMENFESNIYKLDELKQFGITIVLDDFGTGYSSMTYLKVLPISTLKIDKSFIDNICESEIDRKITQEIINLSHILDLNTIAEGVEYIEQLELLREMDCDIIQGYLGGKPMPQNQIFDILDKKLLEK